MFPSPSIADVIKNDNDIKSDDVNMAEICFYPRKDQRVFRKWNYWRQNTFNFLINEDFLKYLI